VVVHAEKLERWLGPEAERISRSMAGWYGPPIPVARVPGRIFAMPDGGFRGRLRESRFDDLVDASWARTLRGLQTLERAVRRNRGKMNAGFASLADLVSEATAGAKRQELAFQKVGPTGVASVTSSLWGVGNLPAAGANAGNAPGGTIPTNATTGALAQANVATGGDTQHFVTGNPLGSVAGNTLLLYDRLFAVNKTMNSAATEAVTGVPTRYQSGTATAQDYIGGNFLFVEVGGTPLAATAHNWTVCTYTNQASVAGQTLPSLTGNSGAIIWRLDHPTNQWFAPLASGDTGVKALTQMQCSALVATGVANFVIGHPLVWMPIPIANMTCVVDGINSAFNLARIFDNACLSFLEVIKPSTTATTYTGTLTTVAG
jgi:hypothetical protein